MNSVLLESANIGFVGEPATWIENCNCPGNYIGQFCEFCSAGHYRAKMKDELFSKCKPCNCNGHSSNCDSETGKFISCIKYRNEAFIQFSFEIFLIRTMYLPT